MDKSNKKRVGQTNTLGSWVKRAKTDSNESSETKNKSIPACDIPILKCAVVQVTSTITSCTISDTTLSSDIGNFLPGTCSSDIIKAKLLEMSNIPENNFVYPYSIHTKKGKE